MVAHSLPFVRPKVPPVLLFISIGNRGVRLLNSVALEQVESSENSCFNKLPFLRGDRFSSLISVVPKLSDRMLSKSLLLVEVSWISFRSIAKLSNTNLFSSGEHLVRIIFIELSMAACLSFFNCSWLEGEVKVFIDGLGKVLGLSDMELLSESWSIGNQTFCRTEYLLPKVFRCTILANWQAKHGLFSLFQNSCL